VRGQAESIPIEEKSNIQCPQPQCKSAVCRNRPINIEKKRLAVARVAPAKTEQQHNTIHHHGVPIRIRKATR